MCGPVTLIHLSAQLHVWQLSEKTVVASVHVLVSRDSDYMAVAEKIRQVLHDNGVHSSTIQPEFGDVGDAESDVSVSASAKASWTEC